MRAYHQLGSEEEMKPDTESSTYSLLHKPEVSKKINRFRLLKQSDTPSSAGEGG